MRYIGSMLALGVVVAVAMWAGGDGEKRIARAIVDDLEIFGSADPDLRSLSAVLSDASAMSTLSSLQRRYELRFVEVDNPNANDPPFCSSGPPGLGIRLCHNFYFRLPASPSATHLRIRFGSCITPDGDFVVDEISRNRVELQLGDERSSRSPVSGSLVELHAFASFVADPQVYELLRIALEAGVASDVAIRELAPIEEPDGEFFRVRVWVTPDRFPDDGLHTFDFSVLDGAVEMIDYRIE